MIKLVEQAGLANENQELKELMRDYNNAFLQIVGKTTSGTMTGPGTIKDGDNMESTELDKKSGIHTGCMHPTNSASPDDKLTTWTVAQSNAEACAQSIRDKVKDASNWFVEQERIGKRLRLNYSRFRSLVDKGIDKQNKAMANALKLDTTVDKLMGALHQKVVGYMREPPRSRHHEEEVMEGGS